MTDSGRAAAARSARPVARHPAVPVGPAPVPGTAAGAVPDAAVQQEKRPVPADVLTAFQLWFVVAALGVVYLVAALLFVHSDRASFVDQLMDEFAKQQIDPLPTRAEVDQLLTLAWSPRVSS